MESHKRLLAIFHIIYGGFLLSFFLIMSIIWRSILPYIMSGIGSDEAVFVGMILSLVQVIAVFVGLLIPLPSLIGGIALLNERQWGIKLLLISGGLSLFNVPLGTALGAYTIWTYVKMNEESK